MPVTLGHASSAQGTTKQYRVVNAFSFCLGSDKSLSNGRSAVHDPIHTLQETSRASRSVCRPEDAEFVTAFRETDVHARGRADPGQESACHWVRGGVSCRVMSNMPFAFASCKSRRLVLCAASCPDQPWDESWLRRWCYVEPAQSTG